MDWQALQDGLKALVAAASGIRAQNIAWDGEPEVMRNYPMAMLELQQPSRDASTDETRHELDDEGRLVPVIVGNRAVTLLVTVKSRDQRGPSKAYAILERLRTRLELPSSLQALDALGVALRDSPATQDISAVSQSREESIAQLSFSVGYVVEERGAEPPDEEPALDTIEHVQLSGEVLEYAGAESPTFPNTDAAVVFDDDNDLLTIG
jgi:hypothetical protein